MRNFSTDIKLPKVTRAPTTRTSGTIIVHYVPSPPKRVNDDVSTVYRGNENFERKTEMTDGEILDWLDKNARGYGKEWVCRNSSGGRGLRLYETDRFTDDTEPNVRLAIMNFVEREEKHNRKVKVGDLITANSTEGRFLGIINAINEANSCKLTTAGSYDQCWMGCGYVTRVRPKRLWDGSLGSLTLDDVEEI